MKWIYPFIALLIFISPLLADDPETYEYNPDLISVEGYILLYDVQGPASYATSTPGELPANAVKLGPVYARACQHGLSLPLTANLKSQSGKIGGALGNGGYLQALRNLKKERADIEGIYDVKVDLDEVRILSIYSRLCTVITARGFR